MSWFCKGLTLTIALCLTGCGATSSSMVRHSLPNGQFLDFQLHQDMPQPEENEWIAIEHAALRINSYQADTYGLRMHWNFAFRAKTYNIARVEVYDVSEKEPLKLIDDDQVLLTEDDVWHMETGPQGLNREMMPWFFQSDQERRVFEFVITSGDGERKELYQMVYFPPELKKAMWEFIEFDDVWTTTYQCIVKKSTVRTQKKLDEYYGLIAGLAKQINAGATERSVLLKNIAVLEKRIRQDYLHDYLYNEMHTLRRQVVKPEQDAYLQRLKENPAYREKIKDIIR